MLVPATSSAATPPKSWFTKRICPVRPTMKMMSEVGDGDPAPGAPVAGTGPLAAGASDAAGGFVKRGSPCRMSKVATCSSGGSQGVHQVHVCLLDLRESRNF